MTYGITYSTEMWDTVKAMWMAGNSASSIASKDGFPSKQAICTKVKEQGWQRIDEPDERLAVIPFDGLSDVQRIAVSEIAKGMPHRDAAARAGVDPGTISRWLKDDENFAKARAAAVWVKNSRRLQKVEEAEDWKAATWLLERDKDSKEDFAAPKGPPPIVANFNVLGHVQTGIARTEIDVTPRPEQITHEA